MSRACPDTVCSMDTTLPISQQHQAGSCSQCGVCRFVCVVCNYVVCMRLNACTCICVVVGMWVCVMRVTPFFSPVSLFSSASLYLYREELERTTGSSKPPSVGRWHLSPLHLHLISQTPMGSRAAGNQCSPSTLPRRVPHTWLFTMNV